MQTGPRSQPLPRLTVRQIESSAADSFAADVRAGLTAIPKTLPPKYFYDELGSFLFDAICCLPEYYLTRAESEILRERATEIIAEIRRTSSGALQLVELGSGSALKTRYLIDAAIKQQNSLEYLPIDISAAPMERSAQALLHEFPGLRISAFAGEYYAVLRSPVGVRTVLRDQTVRNVVLFLGSNIGNFDPVEAREFLREIRGVIRRGDALLMGADLKKSPQVLVPAYDDVLGVTAAFNRNVLVRINRELGGQFDVSLFDHRAVYNEKAGRIEAYLVSRAMQTVRISDLDLEISFDEGETIHTESSHKFDLARLSELGLESGFSLEKSWFDRDRRFSFNLFGAV
ncbi:MAG TPA: L-histidine N(alpha)-methyltransferase [Blastocatellia bacterium]|nr:L-histidine N(alpha)-methyltransferase [Blastocatellia bacterium]